jgi:hypothetical protein
MQRKTVMENASQLEKPIRVGIFSSIDDADRAVAALLDAGFTAEEITVVCSDKAIERHFHSFEHQEPAGSHTATAVTAGGVIGAALGGLTAIAGVATTGGVGLLVAGAFAVSTGGLVGGFIGAMTTRGVDKELANFYDQAVTQGKILVAAEDHSEAQRQSLAQAAKIFDDAGAQSMALPEG